jgi:aspartate racemase
MKTMGMIGGIGPESTIDYYRSIVTLYRERRGDGSYPPLIINSIDLQKLLDLIGSQHLKDVTDYLASEVLKLAAAGAQFAFLAANTPHIVFEDVQRQSPIPLISIVRSACDQAIAMGVKRLGIFGTQFTMQGRFYPDVFSAAGMTIITPTQTEQAFIHEKYMNELVNGKFLPETRDEMLRIALRLSDEEDVAAVILAGTELPLLLRPTMEARARFLDTMQIHVEAIVTILLS